VNELSGDWLDGVVLVLPPTLLARVLVPQLFDESGLSGSPVVGNVISYSFHEDSTHGCSRAHSFSTLFGQLGNVKALVLVLAGLVSYRASRVVTSLALSFSSRTVVPPSSFTESVALFAGPLVLSLADLFSCLAVHSIVFLAVLIGHCAGSAVAGLTDLVCLSTVVSPLIHAVLLVGSAVLSVLLLTVSLAAHAVVFLTLVVSGSARLVVSALAEVAASRAIKRVLTDIVRSSAGHIPVLQARVLCQSTGALIGIAARCCLRLTQIAISSCIDRHNEASFANV